MPHSDYCLLQVIRRNVDGNGAILVAWKSVDHDECPEFSGRVRAEVIMNGFIIAPTPDLPHECNVTHISLMNLKVMVTLLILLVVAAFNCNSHDGHHNYVNRDLYRRSY
jgi:hypothetical protein